MKHNFYRKVASDPNPVWKNWYRFLDGFRKYDYIPHIRTKIIGDL